jgi:hypothetical protein
VSDACCALYITALVAGVLELETNVLHVLDPMVRCICIAIMVAIPLFPIYSNTPSTNIGKDQRHVINLIEGTRRNLEK